MKSTFTIIACLLCLSSYSQDIKKTADDHFANSEWQMAADNYQKYLKKNAGDSSALYNTGYAFLQLNRYEQAIKYLSKAEQHNFNITFTSLGKARAHIGLEQYDESAATLLNGAKNGALAYMRLKNDEAFDPLRDKEAFLEAVQLSKMNAYPCLSDNNFRHFDFWVGEWDVYVNGQKVGENSITMANGGCAIHEDYTTGNRNFTGQSINYYDRQDQKWHQVWVGSGGGVLDYTEIDKADGMLQFQAQFLNPQGNTAYSRLTFTANEDGTVRQLFENSTDGENWTSGFDGLYKKKETGPE